MVGFFYYIFSESPLDDPEWRSKRIALTPSESLTPLRVT